MIKIDDGYQFGLGVFETIAIEEGIPLFLDRHLKRANRSLQTLGVANQITESEVVEYLKNKFKEDTTWKKHSVLKIMLSAENKIFIMRKNPYRKEKYEKGFHLSISKVRRNETSPLVSHKTMNYGENIIEKRKAQEQGVDEPIFVNTRQEITEGSCTNIFFVCKGVIYTPPLSSGLLPGIVREAIMENAGEIYPITEKIVKKEELHSMEECFVTNSLLGIMPVTKIEDIEFRPGKITAYYQKIYADLR